MAAISKRKGRDGKIVCRVRIRRRGAILLEIAEILGYKTLQMVKRYSHLAESYTASVVEEMNERIFGR